MDIDNGLLASFSSGILIEVVYGSVIILNSESDFELDENHRLKYNYLVYQNNNECEELAHFINDKDVYKRHLNAVSDFLYQKFFGFEPSSSRCAMACIDVGSAESLLTKLFPEKIYTLESNLTLSKWYLENCQAKEAGFISTLKNNADVYWISYDGIRTKLSELIPGERNTLWQKTFLGHQFVVVDQQTNTDVLYYTIEFDSFIPVGELITVIDRSFVPSGYSSLEEAIHETLDNEWKRSRTVKRAFSEVGFDKGRLPSDLFNSISTYYYNNRDNLFREEWNSKGLFVNWWEQDSHLITMPMNQKRYWQKRLKSLVEAWSNETLELTDIYGLRRYNEGARLLAHVDRTSTHAASLIINIAQANVQIPWKVEIYDHGDRLHEIEMDEGDIVYYESAKCLHARTRPLVGNGSYYVNLFAHYRPEGDPSWHLKDTPADHAQPLIDISGIDTKKRFPHLSPTEEKISSGADLFTWWKYTSPKTSQSNTNDDEL